MHKTTTISHAHQSRVLKSVLDVHIGRVANLDTEYVPSRAYFFCVDEGYRECWRGRGLSCGIKNTSERA
ncbi:hypothetical protein KDI_08450 [Dictyobacter arantiisoli]|uniref:Uncharacterized protein n=1 Tax=Dictyobacter arantiisoli TaxID=2014874 RepID=A0A5A5T725_9CHLR|nr:hypothetical protein KDI_08450 [Dictyobacter arantiisoli]